MEPMIKISNLKKVYPNVTPLKNVSAEIKKGEVISIIGPSGTGKSTLLRCINLLEKPTEGEILIDGEAITDKNCKVHLLRRKMGMVFQSFNLFAHMNIIENIMAAPVTLLGKSRKEAYERGMELLAMVGLADKALSFPDELSGGQKQRVAIARTLAMNPEIVLFDEPTSALDPTMVGEVLAVIRNLAKEGLTMMIVTHEMKFARNVSTRIFYMDEGEIYEDGTPEQIFDNPQREKTRQFIKHLKIFEEKIDSKNFDFIGLNSRIEEFARRNMIEQKNIYRMQLIIEELCVQNILPHIGDDVHMKILIEYSDDAGGKEMSISYNGDNYNPLAGCDEISLSIVKNLAKNISHDFVQSDDYANVIKMQM